MIEILSIKLRLAGLMVVVLSIAPVATADSDDGGFVGVNQILDSLNPLEFYANHGGVRRSIDLNIEFEFGSARLSEHAYRQVDALSQALNADRLAGSVIHVIGHTDAVGSPETNQALSEERARAVVAALQLEYGVSRVQLVATGMGETQLLEGIPDDDARQRRVEIGVGDSSSVAGESTGDPGLAAEEDGGGPKSISW